MTPLPCRVKPRCLQTIMLSLTHCSPRALYLGTTVMFSVVPKPAFPATPPRLHMSFPVCHAFPHPTHSPPPGDLLFTFRESAWMAPPLWALSRPCQVELTHVPSPRALNLWFH